MVGILPKCPFCAGSGRIGNQPCVACAGTVDEPETPRPGPSLSIRFAISLMVLSLAIAIAIYTFFTSDPLYAAPAYEALSAAFAVLGLGFVALFVVSLVRFVLPGLVILLVADWLIFDGSQLVSIVTTAHEIFHAADPYFASYLMLTF